jgi:UDP-4-amino-4,6-dideoxy-N-acetyl-beta-L-altrosamine N-acetyltransferase
MSSIAAASGTVERGDFRLRPIAEGDLARVLAWRNSEHVRSSMYNDSIISWEDHRLWFNAMQQRRHMLFFVFEHRTVPLGAVYFSDLDHKNRLAHWGFYIGEQNAARGSGAVMGFMALAHVVENLHFHRIVGEVLASNTRSLAFHRKLGFAQEGVLRGQVLRHGSYEDVVTFGLLAEEWQVKRHEIEERVFGRIPA